MKLEVRHEVEVPNQLVIPTDQLAKMLGTRRVVSLWQEGIVLAGRRDYRWYSIREEGEYPDTHRRGKDSDDLTPSEQEELESLKQELEVGLPEEVTSVRA